MRISKITTGRAAGRQEGHPACKNWVMGYWCGYMSGARCRLQICIWPSWCHCHSLSLAIVNPDWFYLSGTGSCGQSRTKSMGL